MSRPQDGAPYGRRGKGVWVARNARIGEYSELDDRVRVAGEAEVGDHVRLGTGVQVGERAHVGDHCRVDPSARIGPEAEIREHVVVGATARIGRGAVVQRSAEIGQGADIGADARIGEQARIGARTTLAPTATVAGRSRVDDDAHLEGGTVVGFQACLEDDVLLEPGASIGDQVCLEEGVVIGRNTWLGNGVVVGAGADIEPGAHIPNGAHLTGKSWTGVDWSTFESGVHSLQTRWTHYVQHGMPRLTYDDHDHPVEHWRAHALETLSETDPEGAEAHAEAVLTLLERLTAVPRHVEAPEQEAPGSPRSSSDRPQSTPDTPEDRPEAGRPDAALLPADVVGSVLLAGGSVVGIAIAWVAQLDLRAPLLLSVATSSLAVLRLRSFRRHRSLRAAERIQQHLSHDPKPGTER